MHGGYELCFLSQCKINPKILYILLKFLQNRVGTYHNFVNKAIDHVVRNLEGNEEIYALAVASYALQLANHNSKNYILQTLDSKSIRRGM